MSNLTPEDVDLRLTSVHSLLDEEDMRLWEGLEDEKISRIAGDEANKQFTAQVQTANQGTESRLSTEVIHRSEGDINNITSLNALAQALSDYRIKTDLEINQEKIAREQLGIELHSRIGILESSFSHREFMIYQAISNVQTDVNFKYDALDVRVRKYEEMLQDITTDSIQITMDNGEINMGAWTILSQAREWDLEILANVKVYQDKTTGDLNQALIDLQARLPVEQDIIDKAIEGLGNSQIIKDLDDRLEASAADVSNVRLGLIKETQDRQDQMLGMAQDNANEFAKQSQELNDKLQAETNARILAVQREAAIRQQELLDEAADRTAEIDEKIAELELEIGDLTVIHDRIDAVEGKVTELDTRLTQGVADVNAAANSLNTKVDANKADADAKHTALVNKTDATNTSVKAEETARIAAVKALNDGLTAEIQFRKDGDTANLTALNNYKASNDTALANVRDALAVNVTATTANASAISALDTRLTTNESETATAKALAASATQKAETALSETAALATQMTTVNASIEDIQTDLGNKADASAVSTLQAQVTNIDGRVTTNTNALTALNTTVGTLDGTVKGHTTAITGLETKQTQQGTTITQLTTDTTALKNSVASIEGELDTKVDSAAFTQLSSTVTKNTNDITTNSNAITNLNTGLDLTNAEVNKKANSSTVTALDSKVTQQGNDIVSQGSAITKLTNDLKITDGKVNTKADASALTALDTKVTLVDGKVTSQGNQLTQLKNTVDGIELEIDGKADSSALTALDSKVTKQGTDIASNTSAITALNGKVSVVEGELTKKADATAVNNLTTRVYTAEGKITSQGTAITKLTSDLATTDAKVSTKADASALTALDTKVTQQGNTITSQGSAITKLTNDLSVTNQNVAKKADAAALTALTSTVTALDGKVVSNTSAITSLSGRVTSVEGTLTTKADASALNNYYTKVEADNVTAGKIDEFSARLILGGTNLLPNSSFENAAVLSKWAKNNGTRVTTSIVTDATCPSGTTNVAQLDYTDGSGNGVGIYHSFGTPSANRIGESFTVSVWLKSSVNGIKMSLMSEAHSAYVLPSTITLTTEWKRYVVTGVRTSSAGGMVLYSVSSNPAQYKVFVSRMQYEAGTRQSDWDYPAIDTQNSLNANASAISTTNTEVTRINGVVTTHGTSITKLQTDLSVVDGKVNTKADSSALTALDSKVTTQGSTITSQGNAITKLTNDLATTNTEVSKKANTTALNALDTKVTEQDGKITAQGTSITNLNSGLLLVNQRGNNLIPDASFEVLPRAGVRIAISPDAAFKGKKGLILTSGVPYGELLLTTLRPNSERKYRIRFKTRVVESPTNTQAAMLQLAYSITDSTVVTQFPSVSRNFPSKAPVETEWVETTGVVTIPATATYIAVRVITTNNTADGVFYFDDVSLEDITEVDTLSKTVETKADASALSSLDTKVIGIDNKVTSQSTALTKLTSDVTTLTGEVSKKADASALTTLDTKVTAIDGRVTSNTSAITSLNSRVTTAEGDIAKKADASVLVNYSTKTETDTAIASSMTRLDSELQSRGNNLLADGGFEKYTATTGNAVVFKAEKYAGTQSLRFFRSEPTGNGTNNDAHIGNYFNIAQGRIFYIEVYARKDPTATVVPPARARTRVGLMFKNAAGAFHWSGIDIPFASLTDSWVKYSGYISTTLAFATEARLWLSIPNDDNVQNSSLLLDNVCVYDTTEGRNAAITADANATAIQTLNTKVTEVDGKVVSQGTAVTKLESGLKGVIASSLDLIPNPTFDPLYDQMGISVVGSTTAGVPTGCPFPYVSRLAARDHSPSFYGVPCKQGDVFELSALVACAEGGTVPFNHYVYKYTSPTNNAGAFGNGGQVQPTQTWTRTTWRFTVPATFNYIKPFLQVSQYAPFNTVWYATDWHCVNITAASKAQAIADANATAIQTLDSKVVQQGKDITSLSTAQTALTNRVSTVEGQVTLKADSSAVQQLDSRVTLSEGKITSNTNAITNLTSTVTTLDGKVNTKADATALNNYYTKVQADTATAGQITTFSSTLKVGAANLFSLANATEGVYLTPQGVPTSSGADKANITSNEFIKVGHNKVILFQLWNDNLIVNLSNSNYICFFNEDKSTLVRSYISQKITGAPYQLQTISVPEGAVYVRFGTLCAVNRGTAKDPGIRIKFEFGTIPSDWSVADGDVQSQLAANANASQTINTEVSRINGVVVAQGTAITNLTATVVGKADTSAVNTLQATVTQQGKDITANSTATTNLTNRVAVAEGKIEANTTATSTLSNKVTELDGKITAQAAAITKVESDLTGLTTEMDKKANATALTSLETKVTEVDGKTNTLATSLTQLSTKVDGNSAAIAVQGTTIDGIKAEYTIKLDVNGLVSGIGLINDGKSSAIGMNADMFYIGKAGAGGKKPFMVLTSPQTIGGVTYSAGTWIDVALIANATIGTAHIKDASITNAKIFELDASKITTGVLNAGRIRVGPTSSFDAGYNPATKARTFITQPTVPYSVGDIWKNGTSTYICKTQRIAGSFTASEWDKVGDVTSENTAANSNALGGTTASTINTNITNADTKATNAASTATAADTKATAADTKATLAQSAANSANNQVNAWKFTGTAEIDGGNIRADTVTSAQISVNELSAISSNLGTFVSGDPNGQRTVITGSNYQVFDANNVERIFIGVR